MAQITINPIGQGDPWADFADAPAKPSLDPRHRDLAIRTIFGEAAQEPDEGKAAVASVIKNRVDAKRYGGDSIPRVVLAPNQFEPWSRPDARSRMMSLKPGDPNYEGIGQIVDRVWSGEMPDPTNGATHFFAPQAQQVLGRQPPRWAQGEGQPIGRHTFYAPEGRVGGQQEQPLAVSAQSRVPQAGPAPQADPWAAFQDAPQASPQPAPPTFDQRFENQTALTNAPQLETGLRNTARQITTGAPTAPTQKMAIEHGNLLSAASQGATPNVDILAKNLISTQVFQGDDGSVQYRDPQTGQVVPTDNTKHIVIRDPADNTPKVYARTAETNEGPATGIARTLAPGLMAGAPTARAAIPAAGNIQPKASDVFSTAKPHYRAFEQQARATPPPQGAADRIRAALDEIGLSEEMAGAPIRSALTYLESGKVTSLNDMQKVKRMVGHGFGNPDKAVRDAAAVASKEIGKIINDVAPTASENLKTADAIHSTARSVQELQRKQDVADLRKGRAGYGGNAVNSMRQVLSPIVQRAVEGKTTNFKPNEIAALREIVEGTPTTNVLRLAGQASPFKGVLSTMGAGAAGYTLGPAVGVATSAGGMLANKLATVLTGKQIERLKELVAKRSPAYEDAVAKAVERYERAQMEMVNNPSPNRLAGYVSASRALSGGLSRDGIQVSSGDLLRRLNSPSQVAAEDQQPGPGIPGD